MQEDDGRYSGGSSPESTGSVETSISSHFGGMNYPSLFSSKPSSHGASQQTVYSTASMLCSFLWCREEGVLKNIYLTLLSEFRQKQILYHTILNHFTEWMDMVSDRFAFASDT